jgi:hypothetical protein
MLQYFKTNDNELNNRMLANNKPLRNPVAARIGQIKERNTQPRPSWIARRNEGRGKGCGYHWLQLSLQLKRRINEFS